MAEKHPSRTEPWLRGTHLDLPPVVRGVVHAVELAAEDLDRCCRPLRPHHLRARPAGGAGSVAFHLRHLVRSLDRLLTYAEGAELSAEQRAALALEDADEVSAEILWREVDGGLARSLARVAGFAGVPLELERFVGARRLPTTVGGLLVHIADHTQRHTGQAITTARAVSAAG